MQGQLRSFPLFGVFSGQINCTDTAWCLGCSLDFQGMKRAKYCSQCGQPVATRLLDGRRREVCTGCDTVLYRNPLPVAAAVVLDAARQVLLVKRRHEPRQGQWCLPMGFAELQETIAHAAQRELTEEAGITGRVVRLLAAESERIAPYGDLLVITFELEKTGGRERAGDDAEAVACFPTTALPPLAFAANRRAIRQCVEAHREQWAIEDSFQHLSGRSHESLLSDALVNLISQRAGTIARAWLRAVRAHPTTPTYAAIAPRLLLARATGALSQFSRWLSGAEENRQVMDFYRRLGAERKAQGAGLPEVISSLSLLRKHTLDFAQRHGVWTGALNAYKALELDHRVILFFDLAMYHAACGYHEALGKTRNPRGGFKAP